jgi:DNA polymerase III epsilon subunit-like protein
MVNEHGEELPVPMIENDTDLRNPALAFFDFETFQHKLDDKPVENVPIEIGIMVLDLFGNVDEERSFETLIQPSNVVVSPQRLQKARINPVDFANAMSEVEASEEVIASLKDLDVIWVAHNAPFDRGVLLRHFPDEDVFRHQHVLDTLKLSRLLFSGLGSYKLSRLAREFEVELPEIRHRSLADVALTIEVFKVLIGQFRFMNYNTLSELIHFSAITDFHVSKQLPLL